MLLQEEQHIVHWLTEYGALTKTQVIRMLKDKPPQTAEKIIRGLKRDVLLYDISGGYYLGVDPMCQPDPRMILAVWVLLQFIDKVEPMAHYRMSAGVALSQILCRQAEGHFCPPGPDSGAHTLHDRFIDWLRAQQFP